MKIAVPTRNGVVDDHFGHCEYYTIFDVEDNKIVSKETLPSPQGCGCKSNIASKLHNMGVMTMLAGNMGEGAKTKLNGCEINVVRGCSGDVESVIDSYLKGEISDSGTGCKGHGADHVCNHGNH